MVDRMHIVGLLMLGALAGALTTWIGLGGGILMTVVLSMLFGPQVALATAAPALWLGNAHRVILFRQHIDRAALLRIGIAAGIGALIGGVVATSLPARVLQFLVVAATALVLVRPRLATNSTGRLWSGPLGGLAGFVTATSGTGGIFLTAALLASGVDGKRFVASMAFISLLMHTGRLSAYAAGGWVTEQTMGMALILAVSIMAGNLAGRWLRNRTSEPFMAAALRIAMIAIAVLAVLSLA